MPNITIAATAEQFAALTAAQVAHDLIAPTAQDKVLTPEAYLQKVCNGAFASYAVQHVVESVDSLKVKVAAHADVAAREKAAALEATRIKEEKMAEVEVLKKRVEELEKPKSEEPVQ